MAGFFAEIKEIRKMLGRSLLYSVNPKAFDEEIKAIEQEEAAERKIVEAEMATEYEAMIQAADIQAQQRLDANYDAANTLTEGRIKPIESSVVKSDIDPAHDRIITRHEVAYYLPNGEERLCTVEIDNARGSSDLSDENAFKSNTIDAYRLYADEVQNLSKIINTPEASMIQTATLTNAFVQQAREEGIAFTDENKEQIVQTMFRFPGM